MNWKQNGGIAARVVGGLLVLATLLTDIAYVLIDPRIRLG